MTDTGIGWMWGTAGPTGGLHASQPPRISMAEWGGLFQLPGLYGAGVIWGRFLCGSDVTLLVCDCHTYSIVVNNKTRRVWFGSAVVGPQCFASI